MKRYVFMFLSSINIKQGDAIASSLVVKNALLIIVDRVIKEVFIIIFC